MPVTTKVTVAIPTYNRSGLLADALNSALAQDYSDFHVIVLDNASTDETPAVMKAFADPRLTYLRSTTNIGALRNWNRAIQVATSAYLCLLSDDDIMLPGFISESMMMLEQCPSAAFSFTKVRYVDANRLRLDPPQPLKLAEGIMDGLDYIHSAVAGHQSTIEPSSVILRSSAVAEVGPFDCLHVKNHFDAELYMRLAARFPIVFVGKELVEVRVHTDRLSDSLFQQGVLGEYGVLAARIDGISHLLRSHRAEDALYRQWLASRLQSLHFNQSAQLHEMIPEAYFSWTERLDITKHEIAELIPAGSSLVLVDESQWGPRPLSGRHAIPFLERNGVYWGRPPNDETAISELERLRQMGASFVVFGWPAFWWLDYYVTFTEYLNSKFRCVKKNSRFVAFDLSTPASDPKTTVTLFL
jgi:glycosyltransferase involved in cell wall biosynthesis